MEVGFTHIFLRERLAVDYAVANRLSGLDDLGDGALEGLAEYRLEELQESVTWEMVRLDCTIRELPISGVQFYNATVERAIVGPFGTKKQIGERHFRRKPAIEQLR